MSTFLAKKVLLGEFLANEIEKRGMSAREFADFVGVSNTTINKFVEFGKKDVGYPSADFMLKLAKATRTDIGRLMRLIDPTVPEFKSEYDPETREIAEMVQQLPPRSRKVVAALVKNMPPEDE